MATKQLNALNPRNFKEKIELLKKKEAASTANFAAAIRDAREICQIAGAYDPALKASVGSGLLDRASLLKTYSVPSVNSPHSSKVPMKFETRKTLNNQFSSVQECLPVVRDRATTITTEPCSFSPGIAGQVRQTAPTPRAHVNTNQQLSNLLSTPISSRCVRRTPDQWRFDQPCSSDRGLTHGPFSNNVAITRPNNLASRSQTASAIPNMISPSNMRPVHQITPPGVSSWQPVHPSNGIRGSVSHTSICSVPPKPDVRCSVYASPTTTIYSSGQVYRHPTFVDHPPMVGPSHSMYNISSLGDTPNATPYGDGTRILPNTRTTMADPATTSVYLDLSSAVPRTALNSRPFVMNTGNICPPAAAQMACTPEWRRVSSDSSIRNSLASVSGTAVNLPAGNIQSASCYIQQQPLSGCAPLHNSTMDYKQDTLRRRFPTEPGSAPNPNAFNIGPTQKQPLPPSELGYPLPPKRVFTGSTDRDHTPITPNPTPNECSIPPCPAPINPLANNVPSAINGSNNSCSSIVFNQPTPHANIPECDDVTQRLSTVFSGSAPNIHIEHRDYLSNVMPTTTTAVSLAPGASLANCDPADLDRFLQVPSAFLDPQDDTAWPGRRDSCTMAVEVLSALATSDENASTNTGPVGPKDDGAGSTTDYPKVSPDYSSQLPTPTVNSNNGYMPNSNARSSSSVLDVANKLGISISSNDYQLLTDPQLANYVTDETTEAQLLR